MKKIHFSTTINAAKEKVWKTLWDIDTYEKWTSAFMEGSTVKTDNWNEGTKIQFLDAKGNGMVSSVQANKPNEYMSFKHLGEIKDGKEDTTSESVKLWAGAEENYTLKEKDGKTELAIEMDTSGADFEAFLIKTWPKALENIKSLAEAIPAKKSIVIESTINAPIEKVWKFYTEPEHITKWAFASDEWHAPRAENDLREGGTFVTRMEAKDGSFGFDFGGIYTRVKPYSDIEYKLGDGRDVTVHFEKTGHEQTRLKVNFDMENTHPEEVQRGGWQNILDNFKKHTESLN